MLWPQSAFAAVLFAAVIYTARGARALSVAADLASLVTANTAPLIQHVASFLYELNSFPFSLVAVPDSTVLLFKFRIVVFYYKQSLNNFILLVSFIVIKVLLICSGFNSDV